MLGLYYAAGACSMAAHIVLEESGEKYEPILLDLAKGEQRSEAYLKLNPLGRVPVLRLDDGTALAENTAILPYLGKQFGLWPSDAVGEAKLLSLIGMSGDRSATRMTLPTSPRCAKRVSRPFSVTSRISTPGSRAVSGSPTAIRLSIPMASCSALGARVASSLSGKLKNYTAFKDRML